MKVTLLFFADCPNWKSVNSQLEALAAEFGFDLDSRQVETAEDAQRLQFRGSPTVLVDGIDAFPGGEQPVGLACRVYRTDVGLAGAPTDGQLRQAVTVQAAQVRDDPTGGSR